MLKNLLPERKDSFVQYKSPKVESTNRTKDSKQSNRINRKLDSGKANNKQTGKNLKEKSRKQKGSIEETVKSVAKGKKTKNMKEETEEEIAYKNSLNDDKYDSNICLKTERKNWAKIVEFSQPSIEVPECSLFGLRDVFKSVMTVRIVHLEVIK